MEANYYDFFRQDNYYKILSDKLKDMAAAYSKMSLSISADIFKESLSKFTDTYSNMIKAYPDISKSLGAALHSYMTTLDSYNQTRLSITLDDLDVPNDLSARITEYLSNYRDVLSEEQTAICDEEVLPALERPSKKLSIASITSIIGLLFTILTFIVTYLPDKQLDEIAANQEIIIEQISEMHTDSEELEDSIQDLTDTIQKLTEIVESMEDSSDEASPSNE